MRGILGSPLTRGNSDVIDSAIFTGAVLSGLAVSFSATEGRQKSVKPFAADSGFAGFAAANDLNEKSKTVGFVVSGLDVPARIADGKVFESGKGVFLDSSGHLVPEGDAGAVYQLNGQVKTVGVTALDHKGVEHSCVTIDLFGGGAPFTPTP